MGGRYMFFGESKYALEKTVFQGTLDISGRYIHGSIEYLKDKKDFKGTFIDKHGLLVMMLIQWPIRRDENNVYYLEKDTKIKLGFNTPIEGRYKGFFYPDMLFHTNISRLRGLRLENLLMEQYEADFKKTLTLDVDLEKMYKYNHKRSITGEYK